jgi:cytochrome c oxidase subunit IV
LLRIFYRIYENQPIKKFFELEGFLRQKSILIYNMKHCKVKAMNMYAMNKEGNVVWRFILYPLL